jgi:hypothetical protein
MALTHSSAANKSDSKLRGTVDKASSYHLAEMHTRERKKDIKKELKNKIK